jgi:ribonuclease-3
MENERIELLNDLELSLGCRFEDILLLDTALTHSSYTHEYRELDPKDNETLEFLGDAVLGLCISDIIIKQFPEYSEGQLSALRASLVNEQTLATVAEDFKLGKYILLGRGEEISGGRTKKSILSDTFEAVTGAMFLDQ